MVTRISRMFTVMVAAAMMFAASTANAAPLGLVQMLPDVDSTLALSSFSGDHLSIVNGQTNGLHTTGTDYVFVAEYDLNADINDSGVLQAGGTLVIDNILAEDLTGGLTGQAGFSVDLTEFGFDGTGNTLVLEFRGTVNSVNAALSSLFPVGATVGIIFYPGTGTGFTDWSTAGWSNTQVQNATLDVFVIPSEIPTPAGASMLIVGLSAMAMRRRRIN